MRKKLLILSLLLITLGSASKAESLGDHPLWLRNTAISPDGQTIAFTYQGDIFTVPTQGGLARQITSSSAYDSYPVWSPDGTRLAFASDREGSLDVFIVNALGGTPRRITTHSAGERPLAFLDNNTVLFTAFYQPAQQAAQGAFQTQVYQVSTLGGRPKMYASIPMVAMSIDAQGRVLYQDRKGVENAFRKHERSAQTGDIWMVQKGQYKQITKFEGHDLSPVWANGKDEFYYISEQDGTLNVFCRNLIDGKDKQLTRFANHPVRTLSASNNNTLAFSWNGEIYTLTPGAEPKKVDVKIVSDNYDSDLFKGYRSSGATQMAVSPSGEEVAFVLRGDVYVTSVKYETTKRITNTDGQERCLCFSPDGRTLVYDSERNGIWELYTATIKNKDEKQFCYATDIQEELLYRGDKPAQQPDFSPDGKKVGFLYDRTEVRVIDMKTKAVTTALEGKYNYSYSDGDVRFEWSPDSHWLLCDYIGIGGWYNKDVALVKADGSQVIDLTESGYGDGGAQWAMGGKAITYCSSKYGYRSHGSWGEEEDVFLMALDGEAWDDFNLSEEEAALKEKNNKPEKKDEKPTEGKDGKDAKAKKGGKDAKPAPEKPKDEVKPLVFDLDNRNYRIARLTASSSRLADYYLSKKGDKLYYIAPATEGGANLMVRDLKKGDTRVLCKGIGRAGIMADKKGENLFLATGQGMKKVSIPSGDVKPITFNAPFSRKPSAERAYMYDHAWRQVKDKFYDENIHGVDWEMYRDNYRQFLPHINNNYDFADLLSELLGELNASHTGSGYRAPNNAPTVGNLAAFFDETYEGNGLKVVEPIARGPLATKQANIQPGDIITSIDGMDILAGQDYNHMLEGKAGKKVRLGVKRQNGKTEFIEVKPLSSISDLLYQRWVEHNEQTVAKISDGRIGYVHIKGMDSESFRTIYSKLLGKYRNCDAVVVDTRYNGGGWLHNDVAILLGGKEYVRYTPRGQYIGSEPFSQWTKPSVMLVNESNYSDAHGTPYTYQTLGIGEIVGTPVPGTMTAVWWETLIDPSLYFGIPQVTSTARNGKPLENQQLTPDILIYNNPADVQNGIDTQLIEATKHLMKKVAK